MILVIDLCCRGGSLGFDEFVRPIVAIVERSGFDVAPIHFRRITENCLSEADAVILCGTPLADHAFLKEPAAFAWLKKTRLPVLGICAGMEVICTIFGGSLGPCTEIGMTRVNVTGDDRLFQKESSFSAYELHTFSCTNPNNLEVLAISERCIQVVRHPEKPIFGVMFHPEVRNDWVVEQFLTLSGKYRINP